MNLGSMIAASRKKASLSLRELARRAKISPSHLSRIENGNREKPSAQLVARLARALKADADALYVASGRLPPDVERWLLATPRAVARLRTEMAA